MKPWAEKVEERFREADDRLGRLERAGSSQETVRGIATLGRATDRLAERWVGVPLGTVAAGKRVVAEATMTLSASYAAGGETLTLPTVPSRIDVRAQPFPTGATTYVFRWDETNDKMLVYVAATGLEVAALTDLSGVAAWPIEVVGEAPVQHVAHRASGPELLLRAEIEVATDVAVHASNYWKLSLRTRDEDTPDGVPFGTKHVTNATRLDGGSPAILYGALETDPALVLAEDTRIVLYAEEMGTAASLDDLVLWLLLRRKVR